MGDFDTTVRVAQEAVDATPRDHPNRARHLNNLGAELTNRYSRTGTKSDLEEAIRVTQEAVDITPQNHPDYAGRLNNLGIGLTNRYSRTGAVSDLNEAIRIGQEAVDATPKDHPDRAGRLNNLGVRLGDRYSRTGAISDLEEALRLAQEAVNATPKDHPDRAAILNHLGVRLGDRYSRTGATGDLEEAIRILQEAVDATPKDHPGRVGHLNNLGNRLGHRYSRTGTKGDLDEAIRIVQEAWDTTPEGHPDSAGRLSDLGVWLSERYSRTGAMGDLDEAIRVTQEAVDATPKDYPGRVKYLNNLGNRLGDRYLRTGAIGDLEQAIQVVREAVGATPKDHPDRAGRLNNLGIRLNDRYLKLGGIGDLEHAILCHQIALRQPSSFALTRIRAGKTVLHHCAIIQDWQQAYDASSTAVHLTSKLTARSLETSDKQHMLGQVVGLASDAAAAALHAAKGPLAALALLEEGRGILATSLEDMRIDVSDLRDIYPVLAEQFVRLRGELDQPFGRNTSTIDESSQPSWHAQAHRRSKKGNEMDALILEIRKQSGFEDFLTAPSEGDMRAAARFGPIVVINVSKHRCDAILVEECQLRHLPLPGLRRADIEEKAKKGDVGCPKTLEWLWDVIARPVLDALTIARQPSGDCWPHVWWIPTGPLTMFPLHAAGYHTTAASKTVLDRAMSSYSSSIKAIIHGRRRRNPEPLSCSTGAVLVAMQDTPGTTNSLPFSTTEVDEVRSICKSMGINVVEPERRKQAVTSRLPHCRLFHFAGHGHTNTADPSHSMLLLDDWESEPLTVATLLEMSLRENSPFLAYLSACGTGQIRTERFVDESIHLISACQLAGFRHVIGTMWEVNDELCAEMARITYDKMRDEGMTDESVCLGLHSASRELRDRWVNKLGKGKHESDFACKVDVNSMEDRLEEVNDRIAMEGGVRDGTRPRDTILVEDDEDSIGPAHWIPYVHIGV